MVGKPVNPKCGNRHDNTDPDDLELEAYQHALVLVRSIAKSVTKRIPIIVRLSNVHLPLHAASKPISLRRRVRWSLY